MKFSDAYKNGGQALLGWPQQAELKTNIGALISLLGPVDKMSFIFAFICKNKTAHA